MKEKSLQANMPHTLLDLSKVRALWEEENQETIAVASTTTDPIQNGAAMPFRRRYSDLEAMARAKKAAAAAAASAVWISSKQHLMYRQRKSLGEVTDAARLPRAQDDLSTRQQQQQQGMLVPKSTFAQTEAVTMSGKRYSEMMERFQIRRFVPPSSHHSHSMTTSRSTSTTRSVKVHPGVTSEAELGDHATHGHYAHSRYSVSSAGRASAAQHSVHIPEACSEDELACDVVAPSTSVAPSWRDWLWQWKRSIWIPISPTSRTSQVRSVVLVVGFAAHVMLFPLQTAYFTESSHATFFDGVERAFEIMLVVDCVVSFNTAYCNKRGELVSSRAAIARQYVRGWLVLDLVTSIPVEWMLQRGGEIDQGTKWFQTFVDGALCLPRFVHVTQIARQAWQPRLHETDKSVFTWFFYSRYSHLVSIATVILYIIVGAHYMACILKLLSVGPSSRAHSPMAEYMSNLYEALQLLQGQGVPTNTIAESTFAATSVLIGSIALAIVFGHVAILVSNFNANSTNYQRKMESVFAIMSKLQLPAPLRERIHQYYEHLWREYESLDGEIMSFAKGLSHTLELEVVLFKYMDLIMHVPFWSSGSPDFQKQLMLHLSVRVYLPDDFIIRRGEVGEEFFMINRGVCEMVVGPDSFECATGPLNDDAGVTDDSVRRTSRGVEFVQTGRRECFERLQAPLTARQGRDQGPTSDGPKRSSRILQRGQAFGELALLMNYERTANVRALSYVEMCVLSRTDMQAIFLRHPKDRRDVIKNMLLRTMENNEANKVECPLRRSVASVFSAVDAVQSGGEVNATQPLVTISATHAALLLTAAINSEVEDSSISFGIGESLKQKLVGLKEKEKSSKMRSPQALDSRRLVSLRPQDPGPNETTAALPNDMNARLEDLHRSQRQLLDAMENLRRDLHDARQYHESLHHPGRSHSKPFQAMTK